MYKIVVFFTLFLFSFGTAQGATLFWDGFGGSSGSVNTDKWHFESHSFAQTQLVPYVWTDGNYAHLSLNRNGFKGTSMRTKNWFSPGNGQIVAEARVNIAHNQRGIVHGFFFYDEFSFSGGQAQRSHELDFEWLTNKTTSSNNDQMLYSTWNNWYRPTPRYNQEYNNGHHMGAFKASGVQTNNQWHTYKMVWKCGSVEFFIDNNYQHGFYGDAVPCGAQQLFLNSWVPSSDWSDAYYSGLNQSNNNDYKTMLVNWVRVTD